MKKRIEELKRLSAAVENAKPKFTEKEKKNIYRNINNKINELKK